MTTTGIAVLTYHPEIGTFRKGRGAYRVAVFYACPFTEGYHRPVRIGTYYGWRAGTDVRDAIFMDVPRRLAKGTYVNPTKLLAEYWAWRRGQSTHERKAA